MPDLSATPRLGLGLPASAGPGQPSRSKLALVSLLPLCTPGARARSLLGQMWVQPALWTGACGLALISPSLPTAQGLTQLLLGF